MKLIKSNIDCFMKNPGEYFGDSYEQFKSFGGPSFYFHTACLDECENSFMSFRHVELIYATLTAWGMHRMGNPKTTKTKLKHWTEFRDSIESLAENLKDLQNTRMTDLCSSEYSSSLIKNIEDEYKSLELSESKQSVVVNSKALFHLLPNLIPPIDRQYTVRFFTKEKGDWLSGQKFKNISIPGDQIKDPIKRKAKQFEIFHTLSCKIQEMSRDTKLRGLIKYQETKYGVPAPKAIDNAIVNYIRKNKPAS